LLVPSVRRTWAPRGQTPLLAVAGHWTKISSISAITVSPKRQRLALYARFHHDKNIRSPQVTSFLRYFLKHVRGPVILLWDGGKQHRSKTVRKFLGQYPRLHVHRFPAYAPELNPDEFVWNNLKRAVANSVPKDLPHLRRLLDRPFQRLKRSQKLLRSCLKASDLSWP
jgi:transposase